MKSVGKKYGKATELIPNTVFEQLCFQRFFTILIQIGHSDGSL